MFLLAPCGTHCALGSLPLLAFARIPVTTPTTHLSTENETSEILSTSIPEEGIMAFRSLDSSTLSDVYIASSPGAMNNLKLSAIFHHSVIIHRSNVQISRGGADDIELC